MSPYHVHSDPRTDRYWAEDDTAARPCARGSHCANRNAAGEPALGPRTFCDTDRHHIDLCIEDIPQHYVALYQRLADKPQSSGGRVSGSRTPPVPPNLAVDTLMTHIVHIVASWNERVCAVANLTSPGTDASRRQRAGVALTRMCRILTAHLDALLALPPEPVVRYLPIHAAAQLAAAGVTGRVHPAAGYAEVYQDLSGADAGLELSSLNHRCRATLGYTPQHEDLLVPCFEPDCGQRMVRRYDGATGLDDYAECRSCKAQYTAGRYTLLMAQVEAMQRAKQTPATGAS